MSRGKYNLGSIVIVVAICVTLTSVSFAQDKGPKDLNNYICKDIMRFSGEERSIAIAFIHGYLLGKKGTTLFNTEELAKASDQFIEYALDNPTVKALDGMNKFVK